MNDTARREHISAVTVWERIMHFLFRITGQAQERINGSTGHPFRVIVNKEISDQVRSWRFIILVAIIALTLSLIHI